MKNLGYGLLFLAACGTSDTSFSPKKPVTTADEIFGGFEASGRTLDAVGSLGVQLKGTPQGDIWVGGLCTATLIGPTTVLTADHCQAGVFGKYDMYFVPGSENAHAPTRQFSLVAGTALPGVDIFVFHTGSEVTDVTPIGVGAPLDLSTVGQRYVAIGYGSQNNAQDAGQEPTPGTRKMGALTFNGLGGNKFERLFGNLEGFINNLRSLGYDVDACLADPACAPQVQEMYDGGKLRDTEVALGLQPGDAQVCHGDSGGPLLKTITTRDGKRQRQTFAVVSHGWFSAEQACYGQFYAGWDASLKALIDAELSWVDPCAGTSVEGTCEGTVATRCTGVGEGVRRLSSIDCAELDQVCAPLTDGKVGCTDPEAQTEPQPEPAPAPADARQLLQEQTQSPLNGGREAAMLQRLFK